MGKAVRETRRPRRKAPLPTDMRAGFALLLGRPNVGKSTLLNRLVGEHLAIVSPRPQTTRTRLLGIVNRPGTQLCLVDAPGVHRAKGLLNRTMVDAALGAIPDMDVVLYLAEAGWPKDAMPQSGPDGEVILPEGVDPVGPFHRELLARVATAKKPVVLVLNKIDLVPKSLLLPIMDAWRQAFDFRAIYPVSALTGANVDGIVDTIREQLPEGPALFAEDVLTDQTERELCAEFIREQVFLQTHDEVPYGTAVVIEHFDESERWPEGMPPDELAELVASVAESAPLALESESDEEEAFEGIGEGADEAASNGDVSASSEDASAALSVEAFSEDLDFEDGDVEDESEDADTSEEPSAPERPLRGLVRINATIVVERPTHKGIVIGRGGERLRKIGTVSRLHIERLLGARVWLELHVRADPEWTQKRGKFTDYGLRS